MVPAMDHAGFGNCTMHRECETDGPKEISVNFITRMNRDYLLTSLLDSSMRVVHTQKAAGARDAVYIPRLITVYNSRA